MPLPQLPTGISGQGKNYKAMSLSLSLHSTLHSLTRKHFIQGRSQDSNEGVNDIMYDIFSQPRREFLLFTWI